MTTLPPPGTKEFPDSSIEKKVYSLIESFTEYIPITNDRSRLGFGLYKYLQGEGDSPQVLLKSLKIRFNGISEQELAGKLISGIQTIKS
jgi:hypothetical protein